MFGFETVNLNLSRRERQYYTTTETKKYHLHLKLIVLLYLLVIIKKSFIYKYDIRNFVLQKQKLEKILVKDGILPSI